MHCLLSSVSCPPSSRPGARSRLPHAVPAVRLGCALLIMLLWPTWSFGAEVELDLVFPQDEVADTATAGLQTQVLETTFDSLLLPFPKPRIAREAEEVKAAVQRRPLEISSMVEGGRFSLLNEDGTQLAVKALAEFDLQSELTMYANLGVEYLDFDDTGDNGKGYVLNLGVNRTWLNGLLKVGGLVTWQFTDVGIVNVTQSVNSLGGGVLVAIERELGPIILTGGVIYQYLRDWGDREGNNNYLSYGLQVGVPIGQRLVAAVEAFQINDLEHDADPVIVGASVTYYFTRQWGLTMGWKTTLNLDNYEAHEGTLGASVRF
jgi:hypothetical protein